MKIDVEKLFRRIGNEECSYYVLFKQGNISNPEFLMLPSDARHLYEELRRYFEEQTNE